MASLLVDPRGNFPLNDDWLYGWSVRTLLEQHQWRLANFAAMPLGPQLLWGALFSVPTGFSFEALRCSTLCLAYVATIGVFVLSRVCGADTGLALLAGLSLAVNPIFFALSYTFMTDVPFLALAVWGFVYLARYLRAHRAGDAFVALGLLTCATLIRQLGVALAFGASCAVLMKSGRRDWKTAAALPAAAIVALVAYNAVLRAAHLPGLYSRSTEGLLSALSEGPASVVARFVNRCGQIFVYTGVFVASIAVGTRTFSVFRASADHGARLAAFGLVAIVGGGLIAERHRMPLSGNILNDLTLLPLILARAGVRPHAAAWIWDAVTVIGVLSAAALVSRIVMRLRAVSWRSQPGSENDAPTLTLFGTSGLIYIAPFLFSTLYDRYLLFWFVTVGQLTLLTVASDGGRVRGRSRMLSASIVILTAGFSIAAMHDTFTLNRSRWTAVSDALADGIPKSRIDGGFEVNGWLSLGQSARDGADSRGAAPPNPTIVIALAPVEGFIVERRYRFRRWMPFGWAELLALRAIQHSDESGSPGLPIEAQRTLN